MSRWEIFPGRDIKNSSINMELGTTLFLVTIVTLLFLLLSLLLRYLLVAVMKFSFSQTFALIVSKLTSLQNFLLFVNSRLRTSVHLYLRDIQIGYKKQQWNFDFIHWLLWQPLSTRKSLKVESILINFF